MHLYTILTHCILTPKHMHAVGYTCILTPQHTHALVYNPNTLHPNTQAHACSGLHLHPNQCYAYTPYLHFQTVYTVRLRYGPKPYNTVKMKIRYGTGNRSTVQACMATRFEPRARPPLEISVLTTIIILYL
jgi:hypothetical protein